MSRIGKMLLVAVPVVLIGAVLFDEMPELRRYLRMKRM